MELDEFAGRAAELIGSVAEGGDAVVVVREGIPVAMLVSPGTAPQFVDLPRWEEWVREVRRSFAAASPGAAAPAVPDASVSDPPEVDKRF